MLAYIGLGSNLNNPRAQVEQALMELCKLPDSHLVASSPLYRSAPHYSVTAPPSHPQPDYVNAVALLDTALEPLALLDALQAIEQAHQRVRLEHWGPRTLDLDILLLDQRVIACERLQVPHPFLSRRNFVLYPLADIAPQLTLPDGRALAQLLAACSRTGLEPLNPIVCAPLTRSPM